MLRWIIVLFAMLPLAGCESGADFEQSYDNVVAGAWPFGDAPTTVAAAPQPNVPHCQKVAYGRAADAKANGFDDDMREAVYTNTYATCADWDRMHPDNQSN